MRAATKQASSSKAKVTIVRTETVALKLPGEFVGGYGFGHFAPSVDATVEDLRTFIREAEDQFGSWTDARLTFTDRGVTATEATDVTR